MPLCVTTPSAAPGPAVASRVTALIDAGPAETIAARQVLRHAGCVSDATTGFCSTAAGKLAERAAGARFRGAFVRIRCAEGAKRPVLDRCFPQISPLKGMATPLDELEDELDW